MYKSDGDPVWNAWTKNTGKISSVQITDDGKFELLDENDKVV